MPQVHTLRNISARRLFAQKSARRSASSPDHVHGTLLGLVSLAVDENKLSVFEGSSRKEKSVTLRKTRSKVKVVAVLSKLLNQHIKYTPKKALPEHINSTVRNEIEAIHLFGSLSETIQVVSSHFTCAQL